MLDLSEIGADQIRPLSRAEYERLGSLDFFGDERVELLAGVVVKMSPTGRPHSLFEMVLVELFVKQVPPDLGVLPQCSFPLDEYSVPEPDIAIVTRAQVQVSGTAPYTAHLVIEIADSSLRNDRGIKAKLYAGAGVPEYWVIDTNERTIEVYRDPDAGQYRAITLHDRAARVSPLLLPDITVCLDELLK